MECTRAVLVNATDDNLEITRNKLQTETVNRRIEYATLLDSDGHIVTGANNDRQGEDFDPCGLVTMFLEDPTGGQIKASCVLEYDELVAEGSELWRLGDVSYDAVLHMYDTEEDGLIRWVVTGVEDENGNLIGMLVSGDVVTGKLEEVESTVQSLGNGFVYIITETDDGDYISAGAYQLGSRNEVFYDVHLYGEDLEVLMETTLEDGVYGDILYVFDGDYQVVAQSVPSVVRDDEEDTQYSSNTVLIRGYPIEYLSYSLYNVIVWNVVFVSACILMDYIVTRMSSKSTCYLALTSSEYVYDSTEPDIAASRSE